MNAIWKLLGAAFLSRVEYDGNELTIRLNRANIVHGLLLICNVAQMVEAPPEWKPYLTGAVSAAHWLVGALQQNATPPAQENATRQELLKPPAPDIDFEP